MPSHTDTDPENLKVAPVWLHKLHIEGSNEADTYAAIGAKLHKVPNFIADPVMQIINDLSLMQNSIINAIQMYPQREHNTIYKEKTDKPTNKEK